MHQKIKVLAIALLIAVFMTSFSIAESTAGLVAHWSFDDQSDPGFDDSLNGNNAEPFGGVTWIEDGISGGAMSFDGIDGYLDAGSPASLDITGDQITISAWVNVDEFSDGGIVSKSGYWDGYRLLIAGSARVIVFQLTGESYSYWGTTELEAGRWYHVAATYDGISMKVYLNGVQEPIVLERSGDIDPTEQGLWIGHGDQSVGNPWSFPFLGDIDELRIYDHALSEAEIGELYHVNDTDPLALVGDIKAFFDASVEAGTLEGYGACPPVAKWRLMRFRRALVLAEKLIEAGYLKAACFVLGRCERRSDDIVSRRRPDWVIGVDKEELSEMIVQLRAILRM